MSSVPDQVAVVKMSSCSDHCMCRGIENESAHVPTGTSRRAPRRAITVHRSLSRALDDGAMVSSFSA